MRLEFRNNKDRQCFEKHSRALRRWPKPVADRFNQRISIIQAARNFEELRAIHTLKVHELKGDRKGTWSLTIHEKWRLLFLLEVSGGEELMNIIEVSNHYDD